MTHRALTQLFNMLDADGSGSFEYRELAAFLRKKDVIAPPPDEIDVDRALKGPAVADKYKEVKEEVRPKHVRTPKQTIVHSPPPKPPIVIEPLKGADDGAIGRGNIKAHSIQLPATSPRSHVYERPASTRRRAIERTPPVAAPTTPEEKQTDMLRWFEGVKEVAPPSPRRVGITSGVAHAREGTTTADFYDTREAEGAGAEAGGGGADADDAGGAAVTAAVAHEAEEEELSFDDFCELAFEMGLPGAELGSPPVWELSISELRARFDEIDTNGSGTIDRLEFVRFNLIDALSRVRSRVIDMVKVWDKNNSGSVSKREFRQAIRELGFDSFCTDADADAVFHVIDEDSSGMISYRELNELLRPTTVSKNKLRLRLKAGGRRGNKVGSMSLNPSTSAHAIAQQLQDALVAHRTRVVDLFREWDEDNDGMVDRNEFGNAVRALGLNVPSAHLDALFSAFDPDGSGQIEFRELDRILRKAKRPTSVRGGGRRLLPMQSAGFSPQASMMSACSDRPMTAPTAQWLPRETGRPNATPSVKEQMARTAAMRGAHREAQTAASLQLPRGLRAETPCAMGSASPRPPSPASPRSPGAVSVVDATPWAPSSPWPPNTPRVSMPPVPDTVVRPSTSPWPCSPRQTASGLQDALTDSASRPSTSPAPPTFSSRARPATHSPRATRGFGSHVSQRSQSAAMRPALAGWGRALPMSIDSPGPSPITRARLYEQAVQSTLPSTYWARTGTSADDRGLLRPGLGVHQLVDRAAAEVAISKEWEEEEASAALHADEAAFEEHMVVRTAAEDLVNQRPANLMHWPDEHEGLARAESTTSSVPSSPRSVSMARAGVVVTGSGKNAVVTPNRPRPAALAPVGTSPSTLAASSPAQPASPVLSPVSPRRTDRKLTRPTIPTLERELGDAKRELVDGDATRNAHVNDLSEWLRGTRARDRHESERVAAMIAARRLNALREAMRSPNIFTKRSLRQPTSM